MTGAGLKKCMPRIRSGFFPAVAISVMLMVEVLDAISASAGAAADSSAHTVFFRAMISGTASIITWASLTASALLKDVDKLPITVGLFLGGELALADQEIQALVDGGHAFVNKLLLDVHHDSLQAGHRAYLGDAVSHGS